MVWTQAHLEHNEGLSGSCKIPYPINKFMVMIETWSPNDTYMLFFLHKGFYAKKLHPEKGIYSYKIHMNPMQIK